MLDLHRPETELAQRFSARAAIEDAEALLASECQRTETTLAVVLAPGPLEVRLPRGAFVQVLYNILANALDASPRGAGLGLSISRSLVAATGGSLRFRSRQGWGTLFHVVLPVET